MVSEAAYLTHSKLYSGFSDNFFRMLQKKAETMKESHRHCVVMFDEMSLKKELCYNKATDSVDGVVELLDR